MAMVEEMDGAGVAAGEAGELRQPLLLHGGRAQGAAHQLREARNGGPLGMSQETDLSSREQEPDDTV